MVKLGLQIKCTLFNVTDLAPSDRDNFGWCLTLKCPQCGEEHKNDVFITKSESHEIQGSRGSANLVMSCSFCKKHSNVDILQNDFTYSLSDSEKFKTILVAEFRGIEPVSFKFDGEWNCSAENSNKKFEIADGAEMESDGWYDYDQDGSCEVSITECEHKFIKIK
ncbi:uncharacterized protein LOC142344700 [Convolutriloba macropyga]|uniref:uncharacterized protein LOC142344700 n=1 Tax=Convolutriloba macropyga TaxID=536237 RepID=UPI003F5268E3